MAFIFPQRETFSAKSVIIAGEPAVYEVISSSLLCVIYIIIMILPFTRFRNKLPERKSFYVYVFFLMIINLLQVIGGILILFCIGIGICAVSFAKLMYFSFYAPLLYMCFLRDFFQKKFYDQFSRDAPHPTPLFSTSTIKYESIN